ncbi:MAG: TIGR04076 family protein [Chloroflexi bacterium]|nr:TIGR04076 family protein [Chloroflexota bacterium]
MAITEETWQFFQQHLGYSDEEMKLWRANPRNADIINTGPALMQKTIIAEVVEAGGCNSQHKAGDRFIFDGAGNLLTEQNPERICMGALYPLGPLVYAVSELHYAGVDPNVLRFNRTHCFDVGVKCGGWGRVIMEVRVE